MFADYVFEVCCLNSALNCGDYVVSVIDEPINMADCWNDTGRGKLKYSEKNLFHYDFVYLHGLAWDQTQAFTVRGQ